MYRLSEPAWLCCGSNQTAGTRLDRLSAKAHHGGAIRVSGMRLASCSPPVYGWFTEGFDTRDLKEAKALLDELAS